MTRVGLTSRVFAIRSDNRWHDNYKIRGSAPRLWGDFKRSRREIARHGRQTDGESELPKFAMDLPYTPSTLQGETANESSPLFRNRWSSGTTHRARLPVEPECSAMPANDRVGLHDNENFFPMRPEPEERDPEGAIKRHESGLRSRLRMDCERAAEKCGHEEEALHRGATLRDLSAVTQTDSLPDAGATWVAELARSSRS
jgi:hypothetical protein